MECNITLTANIEKEILLMVDVIYLKMGHYVQTQYVSSDLSTKVSGLLNLKQKTIEFNR